MKKRDNMSLRNLTSSVTDFKGTAKRLFAYLLPFKYSLIFVVICAILGTGFTVIAPNILGKITTTLYEGVKTGYFNWDSIINIIIVLSVIYVISQLFVFLQNFIMAKITSRTIYNLRNDAANKINRLPLKYLDGRTHGEILSRITNDIETINSLFQHSFTQIISSLTTIVGIFLMMLYINLWMTVIAIVVIPCSLFVTKIIVGKSQKYFIGQQRAIGDMNGHIEETFSGHNVVKAFNHEEKSKDKFDKINDDIKENAWRAEFLSGIMMPMVVFFGNVGYSLIAGLGCVLVVTGSIQVGQVQAFAQYLKQFNQPLGQFANMASSFQSTIAAAERIFELLDETEEIPDKANTVFLSNVRGDVSINHVSFSYSEDSPLITDLSVDVKSGQTVAIVGPTGAGKTTLINLLMRFYDVNQGSITIDGIDIRDMKRDDLHSIFGMVLQDTWLFKGTIEDNLRYGKDGATHDDIVNAAKTAYIDSFIRTLPGGYDMELNEESNNISQGQKQLLTIARAIIANPPILILDEATSSVDTRTEQLIQKAMNRLMENRTSFVIAHRLSTIRDADVILVMNDGDVIENGTHDELMVQNGLYANLYNSQFANDVA